MRVIPVMDLLNGKVVHAIAGKRKEYAPIESQISNSPDPLPVAESFQKLGFRELYIADLDAILSRGDNLDCISQLTSRTNFKVMIDGGFRKASEARPYVKNGASKILFATETLEDFNEVRKARDRYNLPLIGSIDLKAGEIIARSPQMQLPFSEYIQKFAEVGASEILILNLDRVGTSTGPEEELLHKALKLTTLPLLIGGGIRNIDDIRHLEELGISGVLLATALHDGVIDGEDIARL